MAAKYLPGGEALAHLTKDGRQHSLRSHLDCVAKLAGEFGSSFGSESVAHDAGRWHDLGKYSPAFQNMIREENGFAAHIEVADNAPRDHSTAGALYAKNQQELDPDIRAAIAFAIAGHHAGLADSAQLRQRFREREKLLHDALDNGAPAEILRGTANRPSWLPSSKDAAGRRRIELWIRMVFSALCDADFLDTEAFYDDSRSKLRQGWPSISMLRERIVAYVSAKERAATPGRVNAVRSEVRRACEDAASASPGAFSLTVPTGGGKTLAAMSFALAHAEHHGMRRVVVAIPYTSIIEQNADVYRKALGEDAVLEHHSALDPKIETPQSRIASENWDAPVVVTTTVQLLESLLANRPSRCRKLHRLAHSVIVLDEAQTLPPSLLTPLVEVLSLLVRDYGATVVITTATQPVLGRSIVLSTGFESIREIVPPEANAFGRLKRVTVRWPASLEATSYADLADELAAERDVLAIVHRRADARELCELLDARLGHTRTIHLSALMCPQHRSEVLAQIHNARSRGEQLHVVATQVVEAGVDIDFPIVYRALAGVDSIAQAAGRCNREGKLSPLGEVRVFVAPTAPPRGVLQTALGVTHGMLARGTIDLDDPATYRSFFTTLYRSADLDAKQIQSDREQLNFRETARKAKLIENDWAESLIVPWGDAPSVIGELARQGPSRTLWRRLQRFTVSIPRAILETWRARAYVNDIGGVPVLSPELTMYDTRFGLMLDHIGRYAPSALIVDAAIEE